jgi:hypothetical protein
MLAFFIAALLFAAAAGFSQQNKSIMVYGDIPRAASPGTYLIQAGSYKMRRNAEVTFAMLKKSGLSPAYEKHNNLSRVVLPGIKAKDIPPLIDRVRDLGLKEIWIRSGGALDEKWEVSSPESAYSSFEFNPDGNYIVVEKKPKPDETEKVHFGEYKLQAADIVELMNLGILKIASKTAGGVTFSFSDEAGKEAVLEAKKADVVSGTPRTDLFSRTWKAQRVNGVAVAGTKRESTFLFSRAGTYLVTHADGSKELAQWKWKDSGEKEFLYSWTSWMKQGRAVIKQLTRDFLEIEDAHSAGDEGAHDIWEFVPINNVK